MAWSIVFSTCATVKLLIARLFIGAAIPSGVAARAETSHDFERRCCNGIEGPSNQGSLVSLDPGYSLVVVPKYMFIMATVATRL